jgi:hypothetical protein
MQTWEVGVGDGETFSMAAVWGQACLGDVSIVQQWIEWGNLQVAEEASTMLQCAHSACLPWKATTDVLMLHVGGAWVRLCADVTNETW